MRPWVIQAIVIGCLIVMVGSFVADVILPGYQVNDGVFGLLAGLLTTVLMLTLRNGGRGGRGKGGDAS